MKYLLLSFLLLFSYIAFTQSKWNFGLVIGASSKLRLGVPKEIDEGIGFPYMFRHPFTAFLNGGISVKYHLNTKYFFQADGVIHRMDIFVKTTTDYGSEHIFIDKYHTKYRFIEMPFTFNRTWNQKKLQPFLGIGLAPTYIFDAQQINIHSHSSMGVINIERDTCNLMNFYELQGWRHFKFPIVCEIGFQPFAHTVISFRSNIGIYTQKLDNYTIIPKPSNCYGYKQNINMFSLMAKVYLRK